MVKNRQDTSAWDSWGIELPWGRWLVRWPLRFFPFQKFSWIKEDKKIKVFKDWKILSPNAWIIDKETEAYKGQMTCTRAHSWGRGRPRSLAENTKMSESTVLFSRNSSMESRYICQWF
jgi:hypothetical protein